MTNIEPFRPPRVRQSEDRLYATTDRDLSQASRARLHALTRSRAILAAWNHRYDNVTLLQVAIWITDGTVPDLTLMDMGDIADQVRTVRDELRAHARATDPTPAF